MATGVRQRHRRSCEQKGRCGCSWAYHLEWSGGGQRHQLDKGGYPTQREAVAARNEALAVRRGGIRPVRGQTVAQLLRADYDRRAAAGALRPSTLYSHQQLSDHYLIPHLGSVKVADLTTDTIEAALVAIRKQNPRLSANSQRLIIACLRGALNRAVKRRTLPDNPARYVELPKPTRSPVRVWSAEQFGAFLAHPAVADHRLAAAYRLMGLAGLRRGEACGLRWRDVDLDAGVLTVRHNAVVVGHAVIVGDAKTPSGEHRRVDLDAGTVTALKAHRTAQKAERLAAGPLWVQSGYVFTKPDGAPLHPETLTKTFARLVTASGLPPMRLHDLRHLSASLALAAGVAPAVVSKRLGHAGIGITLDLYSHLIGDAGKSAAEAAAALLPHS